jgi:hypothetical protein
MVMMNQTDYNNNPFKRPETWSKDYCTTMTSTTVVHTVSEMSAGDIVLALPDSRFIIPLIEVCEVRTNKDGTRKWTVYDCLWLADENDVHCLGFYTDKRKGIRVLRPYTYPKYAADLDLNTIYWKNSSPIEYITKFVKAYTGKDVTPKDVESFDKDGFGFIKVHADVDMSILMSGLKFMCPRYDEDEPFENRIVYKFANKERSRDKGLKGSQGDAKKWHNKSNDKDEKEIVTPRQPRVKKVKVVDADGFVSIKKLKKEDVKQDDE